MADKAATVPAGKTQPVEKGRDAQTRNSIAEWAVTILLLLFGTTTLVQAFVIPTGSMEDTLLIGDHLLVDKLAYAPAGAISKYLLPYEEPKHGDIIVFRYPVDITQTFVKRVIGVPGDHLKMINRIVYRNGVRLNEPYVYHKFPYDRHRGTIFRANRRRCRRIARRTAARHAGESCGEWRDCCAAWHAILRWAITAIIRLTAGTGDLYRATTFIGKPLLIYWSYRASTEDLAGTSVGFACSAI